jgi:two-component system alkaline phosphatase synthesis response regulator PhoP
MHRILIVEDEEAIREGLLDLLEIEGYEAGVAVDGQEAMDKVRSWRPHLVLLDLMLPKSSGFEVCRHIRKHHPEVFVLMLTAKNEEMSKIAGLEMGADDYITKPFSVSELLARIKTRLRRAASATPAEPDTLEFGGARVDFRRYEAVRHGKSLDLSAKEFQILRFLAGRPGEVVAREELLQAIWGYAPDNMPTTRTVDNQILKLRQKLEKDAAHPHWIKSVRGVGYKFDPEGSAEA